jgi:methylenetetrahydrofolate reductase (NADPH)
LSFRLIYEVDPPREATLTKFFRQLEIFGDVVDAVLIPDNHLGRSAISSVALAIESAKRGVRPIVALNARDRNHLRLHSDFLTLRAYGVEEVLLLFGDRIEAGRSDLTVRRMLEHEGGAGLRRGVVAPLTKALAWRRAADFLVTQLGVAGLKSAAALREQAWSKPVYGGTAALPTRQMATKVLASIPGFTVPDGYLESFDEDPESGFRFALDCLDELCDGGVDGAHLVVPAGRLRFAEMLGDWVAARRRTAAAVVECPT